MTTDYDALVERAKVYTQHECFAVADFATEVWKTIATQAAEIERLREYVADQTERGDNWFDRADAAEEQLDRKSVV